MSELLTVALSLCFVGLAIALAVALAFAAARADRQTERLVQDTFNLPSMPASRWPGTEQ